MIQVLDWLYENELRSYPFKESGLRTTGGYTLPNDVIVDAQFAFDYVLSEDVKLETITSMTTTITFEFNNGVIFAADKTLATYQYLRLPSRHLLVIGPATANIPEGVYTFTNLPIEPSLVHEFAGPWLGVQSMKFDDSSELTGELNFIEGIQFDIDITDQDIAFAAGNIYGQPIGCTHFSDYTEDCDSIISFINGVGPDGNRELFIRGGNGIVVWDDPPNHRIYVGFLFTSIADVCKDIPPFPI